ncbi:5'/3'-nucleotidase SurE [Candidatus Sumerlaeota bacterium]|nr:5'/3'-nucleotidase SurE [Candidatus Sumerlaeota bacterium]
MSTIPNILLCNDDGIDAPGMTALREAVAGMGELYVVAPSRERSAASHAVTVFNDFTMQERRDSSGRVWGYAVDGTPADCVKFALTALDLPRPDLVVSGINNGSNTGNNIQYSGTVAAALEAAMFGIPAIAVSLCYDFNRERPDFSGICAVLPQIIRMALERGIPERAILNVNAPSGSVETIRGVEATRQGHAWYSDIFTPSGERNGLPVYCNSGTQITMDRIPDSDSNVVRRGCVSITPLRVEWTAYEWLDPLREQIAASLDIEAIRDEQDEETAG